MKTLSTTLLILLLSTVCLAQEVGYIKMRSYKKPIVQAEINGKKGYFLVDTGADISIINSTDLKKYKLIQSKTYGSNKRAIGFNGDQETVMRVKNVDVQFNNQFNHKTFYSMNIGLIVRTIEAKTGLKISGILGSDWLMKYHCIIDYNQRRIVLVNGRSKKLVATK